MFALFSACSYCFIFSKFVLYWKEFSESLLQFFSIILTFYLHFLSFYYSVPWTILIQSIIDSFCSDILVFYYVYNIRYRYVLYCTYCTYHMPLLYLPREFGFATHLNGSKKWWFGWLRGGTTKMEDTCNELKICSGQ